MPTTPSSSDGLEDFCTFFQGFTAHDSNIAKTKILFQSYPEKPFKNELPVLSYYYKKISQLDAAFEELEKQNYLGYSGNFCFNEISGKKVKENVTRIRCFVVDVDSGIQAEVLEELINIVKPSYAVVSSRTGKELETYKYKAQDTYRYKVHLYWMLSKELGSDKNLYNDWPLLQQALAFKVEDILVEQFHLPIANTITGLTDKGITNPAGTMRVPGLIHAKDPTSTYLSRTVHSDESIVIEDKNFKEFFNNLGINSKYLKSIPERLEDIKELKKAKGQTRKVLNQAATLRSASGCVAANLYKPQDTKVSKYNGADEGDRHRSMVDYCRNLFFNRYFSLNEAAGAVKEENLKNNQPPLEEVELEQIVAWCFEQYLNSLTASKRARVLRGDSFAVKDLIKEATWTNSKHIPKEPKEHKPFQYDYSDITVFPSLISDNALAEKLVQRMRGKIGRSESAEICSYVADEGLWSFDDGYVYDKMKEVFFDTVTDTAVKSLFENNKGQLMEGKFNNFTRSLYSSKQQNAVAAVLQKSTKIKIKQELFNHNPTLLHTLSGTLDIETKELKEWKSKDYITMTSGIKWVGGDTDIEAYEEFKNAIDYKTGSFSNLWTRFLYEVMGGDLEMCHYLHKICGYSLLGGNPEELIFFLYGDGQNGKSVFIETLIKLLGEYAFTVPVGIFTENGKENKAALAAQLVGKRVIKTSEVKSSHVWDEASIKNMSGIYELNARALFKESFNFTPCFKTFVAGNHRPQINTNDFGVWRRIRLIPFDVTIPSERRDTKLFEKLSSAESMQEILVWAVAGYQLYKREGLIPPLKAQLAVDEYRKEQNPLSTFMDECFEKITGANAFKNGSSLDDVLTVYNDWKAINAGEILTKQQMSKQLHKDKFQSKVIWDGEKAVKRYPVVVNDKWKRLHESKKNKGGGGEVIELFKKRIKAEEEAEEA